MAAPFRLCLLAGTMLAAAALTHAARAGELALTRVMLSSAGVGYVEYAADPAGAATLGLDVPLSQVDDVLKSLVVFDSAGGVGGLSLPGRDGRQQAFGDIPVPPEALAAPLDYLNALRGVAVEVRGPAPMSGRIMRAERVPEPAAGKDGNPVERTRVTLMTDAGLRQFVLEEAESVQVTDPDLRARLARALAAISRDSASTARHITLSVPPGTGPRQLRVGYVAAAPLWKVAYRLVLPAEDGQPARLQGWAVLENATGADWKDVEVTLQYGNPVTFRQAIYGAYFVPRPEVPLEVLGRLLPGVDAAARPPMAMGAAMPAPPPPPAPASLAARAAPAPKLAEPAQQAEAAEGAQETVFTLPAKVTLAAGQTASQPILDRQVKASRIGLVQPGRPHPLAAIRLTNDTPTSLPAGVLTLYDPASPAMFAGDARLGGLPSGESRLLSFAEDLRSTAEWAATETTALAALTALGGVLHIEDRLRQTATITLTAPAQEPRDLLVEIAKRPGFSLVSDNARKPVEETAAAWRFAVSLAPGETKKLAVQADRITRREVALLDDPAIVVQLLGTQGLSQQAKAALQSLADRRAALTQREAEVKRIEDQRAAVAQDQDRTRANIAAVPANDALRTRFVRQLEAQEDRLTGLARDLDQARAAVVQAQKELEDAVAKFSL